MPRTITEHEMERRRAMAAAKCSLTDAMSNHALTALEWVLVLTEITSRMTSHGLVDEWKGEE